MPRLPIFIALLLAATPLAAEQLDAIPTIGAADVSVRDLSSTHTYALQYGDGATTRTITFPPGPNSRAQRLIFPALDSRTVSFVLARRDGQSLWTRLVTKTVTLADALSLQFDDVGKIDQFIQATADAADDLGASSDQLLYRHRYSLMKQRYRWLTDRRAETQQQLLKLEAEMQYLVDLNSQLNN